MPKPKRLGDRQLLKAMAARAPDGPSFAILAGLLAFADDKFVAWPSNRTLADTIGVSLSTLERRIPALERRGFFQRKKIYRGGRLMKTEYHMSGFIQQSLAFDTVTEKALDGPIPSERRDYAVTEKALIPSPRRNDAVTATAKGTIEGTIEGTSEGRTIEMRSSRRSRVCPDNFELDDELIAFALDEGLTRCQAERELAKMKDHDFAAPRSRWRSVFRNWIRRAAEDAPRRQGGINYAQKARDETTSRFMSRTAASK